MRFFKNPIFKITEDAGLVSIFKTIGCVGDSLSSGEHEKKINGKTYWNDYYEYSWGQYIARKCGNKVYNFSRGGMNASMFLTSFGESVGIKDKEKACQCYIIALGVNDVSDLRRNSGLYEEMGSFRSAISKDYQENMKTFLGCYLNIIRDIRGLVPESKIFVVTPPKSDVHEKDRRKYYDKFARELNDLPNLLPSIYVIDLRKYAPYYGKKFRDKYFNESHMNAMGYKFSADMIGTYMNYIINKNYKDFKEVAYINREKGDRPGED